jgi:diamine N-acetyltransferase
MFLNEAFDPYILCNDSQIIGFFYLSYTPDSTDNYWISGFQIDKKYQGKGYGFLALKEKIDFIKETHIRCKVISLTIEKNNTHARRLYEKVGFINQDRENESGEIIYKMNE